MSSAPSPYPLLAAYLERLPRGLDSYPDCLAKASIIRHAIKQLQRGRLPEGLDPRIRGLLESPPPFTAWIPEAHYNAASLAISDARGEGEEGFGEMWYRTMVDLVNSPLYRMVLGLLTPKGLLSTAAKRWALFHRGTRLGATPTANGLQLSLHHQPGLLDATIARGYMRVFQALVDLSREPGAQVVQGRIEPMCVSWELIGFATD